jgi:hypothetical protein
MFTDTATKVAQPASPRTTSHKRRRFLDCDHSRRGPIDMRRDKLPTYPDQLNR